MWERNDLIVKNIILAFKRRKCVLTGVAQWIECWPAKPKDSGLIPSQGTCQIPSWGHVRGDHTLMFLYLSFSLLSLLFQDKYIKS